MVAPVTGPLTRSYTRLGPPNAFGYRPVWEESFRQGYRQKKPYTLPLPLYLDSRRVVSASSTDPVDYESTSSICPSGIENESMTDAYNACYSGFVEKCRTTASWAVTFAERKQAVSMIRSRSLQLALFANDLRRFRFGSAAKRLGLARNDPRLKAVKLKRDSKALGNNWLEFWFGWSPLVSDIGASVQILQDPIPNVFIRTRKSKGRNWAENYVDQYGSSDYYQNSARSDVSMRAAVRVTNSDLLLANQMGFVNPLTIAWELVPFSFVVDWFVNVGDVISSMTDLVGLELVDPSYTRFHTWTRSRSYRHANGSYFRSARGQSVFVQRVVGAPPGPTLQFNPPERLSLTRAATAISLLLQRLR